MSKSDKYARHAEECRRMASCTKNVEEQRAWLRLAQSWREMVQTLEKSAFGDATHASASDTSGDELSR